MISPNLLPFKSLISKPPVSTLNLIWTSSFLTSSFNFSSAVSNTDISPSALTCNCTLPALFISSTAFLAFSIADTSPLASISICLSSGNNPKLCANASTCSVLSPKSPPKLDRSFTKPLTSPDATACWISEKPFFINAAFVTISSDVSPISLPCLTKSFTTASNALLLIAPCRSWKPFLNSAICAAMSWFSNPKSVIVDLICLHTKSTALPPLSKTSCISLKPFKFIASVVATSAIACSDSLPFLARSSMLSMLSLISRYAFDTFCISCITSSTSPNLNVLPVNLSYALIKSLSFKPFMNDCLSNAAAFILSELPSLYAAFISSTIALYCVL